MENPNGQAAGCGSQRTTLCHTRFFKQCDVGAGSPCPRNGRDDLAPTIMNTPHLSVLYKEIIHALQPRSGGRYVYGTLGAGGHARGIMEASAPDGELLGLDVDPQAIAIARRILAPYENRLHLAQASYISLTEQLAELGWEAV